MSAPWYPVAPGPLVTHAHGTEWNNLVRDLRKLGGRHDDTAWVHPAPPSDRDGLGPLSIALCDATGAVGFSPPPTAGERHLLRACTHLLHGPIRHLIVDDPINLDAQVLTELHQICLIASVQLWLIVDPADNTRGRPKLRDLLDHTKAAGTRISSSEVRRLWTSRPTGHRNCTQPNQSWWTTFPAGVALPAACSDHTAADGSRGRAVCFLSRMRRALTRGDLTATTARTALNAFAQHPDATATDHWALAAARREHYTAGMDALAHLHPAASEATLADVSVDGRYILIDDVAHQVPPARRASVARLRTSRRLGGALPHESVAGFPEGPDATRQPTSRRRTARS